MTVIPNFILKRLYVDGSLRHVKEGVAFDIKNTLGPGQITQLNNLMLGERIYGPERVTLEVDGQLVKGSDITGDNPATFMMHQVITVLIDDPDVPDGDYTLTLDLVSREAGQVALSVDDNLSA